MAGIFDPNIFQGQGQFLFQVDQLSQPGGHYLTPEQVAALKKRRAAQDRIERREERKRKREALARETELRAVYDALIPKPPEPERPVVLKRSDIAPAVTPIQAPPIDWSHVTAARIAALEEDDIEVLLLDS